MMAVAVPVAVLAVAVAVAMLEIALVVSTSNGDRGLAAREEHDEAQGNRGEDEWWYSYRHLTILQRRCIHADAG